MELSAFSHYKSLKPSLTYTDVRFRLQSHGGNDTADKSNTDLLWRYKTHKYNLWSYKLYKILVVGNKKRSLFFVGCFGVFLITISLSLNKVRGWEVKSWLKRWSGIGSSFALHSSLLSTCKSLIPFRRIDHRAHERCNSTSKVIGAVLTYVKNHLP